MIIDRRVLLFFAVFSFLLILLAAWLKITHFSLGLITANILLTIAIVPGVVTWLVVLFDILKHSFRNSLFWIVGMFCCGNLVTILYLSRRDKLVARAPRF